VIYRREGTPGVHIDPPIQLKVGRLSDHAAFSVSGAAEGPGQEPQEGTNQWGRHEQHHRHLRFGALQCESLSPKTQEPRPVASSPTESDPDVFSGRPHKVLSGPRVAAVVGSTKASGTATTSVVVNEQLVARKRNRLLYEVESVPSMARRNGCACGLCGSAPGNGTGRVALGT